MNVKVKILLRRRRFKGREAAIQWNLLSKVKELYYQNLYLVQRDRMERELFHNCIILKNLAIVQAELPLSTDFILEQLMESSKPLRTTYADILTAYRKGKHQQAFDILPDRLPTKTAKDFARILSRLDDLLPMDLVIQMEGFESAFSAERKTKALARAERKSLVTTLTSTAAIFVVLLNFTVVVIFLDTLRTLQQLF